MPCDLNENLAEMIGIILGDGGLYKPTKYDRYYRLQITLNGVDEAQYVYYVSDLMKSLFGIEPIHIDRPGEKTIDIRINSKSIVEFLINIGLKTGNKVKNLISVPKLIKKEKNWIETNYSDWCKKIKPLVIGCIKGLIDTDGSFYILHDNKKRYTSINISFTNASKPLVIDFKEMCESLDIHTSEIILSRDKNGRISFKILIQAKDQVYKFISIIHPNKWHFNRNTIGKELKKYGVGTSIKEAIQNVFKYKISNYTKERAEYLKQKYEELGSFKKIMQELKKKGEPTPYFETIPKQLKKLFNEIDYLETFGENGYQEWFKKNSGIIIDNQAEIKIELNI
jgi:hypothetical protein